MVYELFGKPAVFWVGLVTLLSFMYQLYSGYWLSHGRRDYFTKHKINSGILFCLVLVHMIFGLMIYL